MRYLAPFTRICVALLCLAPGLRAQSCTFVSGSGVKELDATTYAIDVSVNIPAGNSSCSLPFSFAAPGTVTSFQGTQSLGAACTTSVLTTIKVDGDAKYYTDILRDPPGGGVDNVVDDFSVPLSFSSTAGSITVGANVATSCL